MAEIIDKKIKKDIVSRLSLDGLKDSEQDQIINELLDIISSKTNLAILNRLTEKEQRELEKISKAIFIFNKNKKMQDYISSKIYNVQELMEKATVETVEDFKKVTA